MSTGLPFDRTRYNPVQDVTPDEAERNKRAMGKAQAAQDVPGKDALPTGEAKDPDPKPTD